MIILDSTYKNYNSIPENKFCILFKDDKILIRNDPNKIIIPSFSNHELNKFNPYNLNYLGMIGDTPCFAGEIKEIYSDSAYSLIGLIDIYHKIEEGMFEEDLFWICGRAYHIINWSRNNVICGRCGNQLDNSSEERSKKCKKCGFVIFPKISPAIIVAVIKDDKILLGRAKRFRTPFYSVLAGFVEPGESLEECVKREVKEESGIAVKNIRYFGSQPWPFPDSLMIGFTAEYESGDIIIDKNELVDAQWFTADKLPLLPTGISISRKLIDWFCEGKR